MPRLRQIPQIWHTVKYLKPAQVFNRVLRRVSTLRPLPVTDRVNVRRQTGVWAENVTRPESLLEKDTFCFINQTQILPNASDWNKSEIPKLWLYNLHYHDGLHSTGTRATVKRRLLERWIKENPFSFGNGWEPYPTSLRIVNWIKWLLEENKPVDGMRTSLAQQAHALSVSIEYHLLGNHLFANAKALFFAGCFFEGPEAEKWLALGQKILATEIPEQFLGDGGHFELSSTYHATLTEDLLDIINISQAYGIEIDHMVQNTAVQALSWLAVMTRPDGLPPLFNDAAYGVSPTLAQLTAYGKRIGIKPEQNISEPLIDLPESGYFRFEGADYSFWGDAGQIGPDYIPGHAHCDMLSFELFAHGIPIVVDTGTSTYEVGERRHVERSTAAHNTVQLGNREQSEIWSAFRVARRAKIIKREAGSTSMVANYQMYGKPNATHERHFEFSEKAIRLYDRLDGKLSNFRAAARFHCHPDVQPKLENNCVILGGLRFHFKNANRISLVAYNYAPKFNKLLPAKCIEVEFDQTLTTEIHL